MRRECSTVESMPEAEAACESTSAYSRRQVDSWNGHMMDGRRWYITHKLDALLRLRLAHRRRKYTGFLRGLPKVKVPMMKS